MPPATPGSRSNPTRPNRNDWHGWIMIGCWQSLSRPTQDQCRILGARATSIRGHTPSRGVARDRLTERRRAARGAATSEDSSASMQDRKSGNDISTRIGENRPRSVPWTSRVKCVFRVERVQSFRMHRGHHEANQSRSRVISAP